MKKYILKRLLYAIPTVLGVGLVVFFAVRLVPGDPAEVMLGTTATREQIELLRDQLGLNKSLLVQMGTMIRNYATGNLGVSIMTGRPVAAQIISQFPHSARLALAGMTLSVVGGLILGVLAAKCRGSSLDLIILNISTVGIAIPIFWSGILMSWFFGVKLGWLPTIGAGKSGDWFSQLRALILPACALGFAGMAFIARMTRTTMLDVLVEDYVRTARAKGVAEGAILFKHALKSASIPIITVIGYYFGLFLAGTVIIETVFARPGLGKMLVDAMLNRDYPTVQGVTLFLAMSFIIVNLLTDLAYSILDPRVRQQE